MKRTTSILAFICLVALGSIQAQTVDYYTIQNHDNNEYIRYLNAAIFIPGLDQYKWTFEQVPGTTHFWLKGTDGSGLHTERGPVEQSAINPDWHSAHWEFVPVSGMLGFVQIKNRYRSTYLCYENGVLACSGSPLPGTDQWKFVKVSTEAAPAAAQNTPPAQSQPTSNPNADLMQKAGKFMDFVKSAEQAYTESKKETPPPAEPTQPTPPVEEEPAPTATELPTNNLDQVPGGRGRTIPPPNPSSTSTNYRVVIDCFHAELENEGTGNTITVAIFSGGTMIQKMSVTPTCSATDKPIFNFNPTAANVTHVRISTNGTDAFFADRVILRKKDVGSTGGFELVKTWGDDNGQGYCLSTDPQDAFGGWKGRIDGCYSNMDFKIDGSIRGF